MRTSDTITKISADVVKAHEAMTEVKRNAENPFTKSDYADLEAVLKTIRPILAKNKLALIQVPGFKDGLVYVTSRLIHESGEFFEDDSSAGVLPPDPQKVGAAITYLRRYAAMAICGIAPEDEDANPTTVSKRKKKGDKGVAPTSAQPTEKSIEAVVKGFPIHIKALLKEAGIHGIFEAFKLYKAVEGDMDALKQLLEQKIRKAGG